MANPIRSIGVLCSGGDSPGMNCAIRAVVRAAIANGLEVYGIKKGYSGILEGNIFKMNASSVANIIQHGGTILQTSRCLEFHKPEIRLEAAHILQRKGIDGLVVIGGNGSFMGAGLLNKETGLPVIGIPGTIDNDISGTEYSIGFDTAIHTAVEAVDKIRDTASSHDRTFIIEVMGRRSPQIALKVAICTGAENVIIPDGKLNLEDTAANIMKGLNRGKTSSILIACEDDEPGMVYKIKDELKKSHKIESHVCVLGHIQRGGNPTPTDRYMASQMGALSIKGLLEGHTSSVTAVNGGKFELVPLDSCLHKKDEFDMSELELVKMLSI